MNSCPMKSHYDLPWQATFPGILSNFNRELLAASNTSAQCHSVSKKLTSEAVFFLCTISLFVVLTITGSSFGLYENLKAVRKEKCSSKVKRHLGGAKSTINTKAEKASSETSTFTSLMKTIKNVIACFCIQNNLKKVLDTSTSQPNFRCLHGLKGITMFLSVFSHTGILYATALKSLDEFQNVLNLPYLQFKYNGIIGIDVFLVVSGFLLGHSFTENYEKRNGKISWISFYVYRYLKISPLYFLALGFYSTVLPYIGSGPVWPAYDTNPVCRENWIWHVFYINNFNSHQKQCVLTNWYLPLDMQLYVISPIFLIPLMRKPKLGYIIILLGICGSCMALFGLTIAYNLSDGVSKLPYYIYNLDEFYTGFWLYFDTVYVTPYTRIGPFLIGMLLGHYLYRRKFNLIKRNNMVTLIVGWVMCVFFWWVSYTALQNRRECPWETAVYNGLKHVIFSCSASWIIFACVTGQGGFVNQFLSNKLLLLFSRISFTAYLIHLVILEGYFLAIEELIDYSATTMALQVTGLALTVLATSFVVSLFFEAPLIRIVSLFFKGATQELKKIN